MEIKVKKAVGSAERTTSTLSVTAGLKLPEAVKARVKQDVGDYLLESLRSSAHAQKSPVEGGGWKASLSPAYKKKKAAEGFGDKANLEAEGDLLDDLDFEDVGGDDIEIGWVGAQAAKADGHANLSGDSLLPERRLIPDEGQKFVGKIQDGIEKIVADAIAEDVVFDAEDFAAVSSRSSLYDVLAEYFPDFSRAEVKSVIARAPDLVAFLEEEDLWGYL